MNISKTVTTAKRMKTDP